MSSGPVGASAVQSTDASANEEREDDYEENAVDVHELVFHDEENIVPKAQARSRSIASISSAAISEEVCGHCSCGLYNSSPSLLLIAFRIRPAL